MYLSEEIKKVGNKWVVYPKKPKSGEKKRKPLGVHNTKEEALAQLRAIEISKLMHESTTYMKSFNEFINENISFDEI